MKYDYAYYKERVGVIDAAIHIGYKYDPSKGRLKKGSKTQPHFILPDGKGGELDSIYIKNPHDNATQGYWRRSLSGKVDSGDLISFVRENLASFTQAAGARNEIDAINKVLASLANVVEDPDYKIENFLGKYKEEEDMTDDFDIDRYDREQGNVESAMKFLSQRGISRETAELFRNSIEMVHDKQSKYHFKNLAFPYRIPGNDDIAGYELRGYNNFKSKAKGTNSSNACWMAYLGTHPHAGLIYEIHIAESALDIMAFVQVNRLRLKLDECIFVSFGGTFADGQMKKLLETFPGAEPVLHFDNDLNGIIYDCRTASIMAGKDLKCQIKEFSDGQHVCFTLGEKAFTVPLEKLSYDSFRERSGLREKLTVWKAPEPMKDWNDVLMVKEGNREKEKEEANRKMEYESEQRRGGRKL